MLPSIRKTGKYELQNETDEQLIARALVATNAIVDKLQNRVDFLEERVAVREQQIAEMNPKVAYYDTILNSKGLTSTTTIAKDYGMSDRELNKILHLIGISGNKIRPGCFIRNMPNRATPAPRQRHIKARMELIRLR